MRIKKVKKRDGTIERFNERKIYDAISKAGYVSDKRKEEIANRVANLDLDTDTISIELIQEVVEQELHNTHPCVAEEYARYRKQRQMIRDYERTNSSILEIIALKNDAINQENSNKNPVLLSTQRDYIAGEVNKDISMRLLLAPEIVDAHNKGILHYHDTDYAAQNMHNCCLDNIKDMSMKGTVISNTMIETSHSFLTECNIATQIMAQIASNQYGGQSVSLAHLAPFVEVSRKSHRLDVIEDLDDTFLGRVILKKFFKRFYDHIVDKRTERRVRKEIKQGVQIIQYQINTLMTTNGQTPFVTIWMYLEEVAEGRTRDDLAMIIEEVLKQRHQGVKNEKGVWITPAFPKLVYALTEENARKGSKYYYLTVLAARCTAKRMVPDYVSEKKMLEYKYPTLLSIKERRDRWGNVRIYGKNPFGLMTDSECDILTKYIDIKYYKKPKNEEIFQSAHHIIMKHHLNYTDMFPIAYPPMGCRSFLTPDLVHYKTYGRFNQGVVTINLVDVALTAIKEAKEKGLVNEDTNPTIAMRQNVELFWDIFEERLELCHRALQTRHNKLKGTLSDVSPIHWQFGGLARLEKGETIDALLYNGYSTISLGYAGLYECVYALTGKSHTDESVKPFALDIMKYMNDKCREWKDEENIDYSVYGTPLESTTYKFAQCLRERFGVIENVTDHDYITNSYHVNVREHIDPFTKLKFESEFQHLSPGGAISYIETANLTNNEEAVLSVIEYIYDNILYAELNTKSDYCQVCGYDGEIQIIEDKGRLIWECPNCKNRDQKKMNVARRTCGYIGSQFWNQGRTQEIKDRVVHLGGGNL